MFVFASFFSRSNLNHLADCLVGWCSEDVRYLFIVVVVSFFFLLIFILSRFVLMAHESLCRC